MLRPGGKFVFSRFGEAHMRLPYYARVMRYMGFHSFARRLEQHRFVNFHCYNLYTRSQWKNLLETVGMVVCKYITFGGCPISIAFYNINHFLHKYTGFAKTDCFPLSHYSKKSGKIFKQ
ncbi:MAG: hypothetical protein ACFFAE_14815 [Candidatus Hodarchaeota archaeon]